jgi:hypothetical protein
MTGLRAIALSLERPTAFGLRNYAQQQPGMTCTMLFDYRGRQLTREARTPTPDWDVA